MPKLPGKFYLSLSVELPTSVVEIAEKWVSAGSGRSLDLDNPHLTLAFIGDGLEPEKLAPLRAAGQTASSYIASWPKPLRLSTPGELVLVGRKNNVLALGVFLDNWLRHMRGILLRDLAAADVQVRNDFGNYAPHITVARASDLAPSVRSTIQVVPESDRSIKIKSVKVRIGDGGAIDLPVLP